MISIVSYNKRVYEQTWGRLEICEAPSASANKLYRQIANIIQNPCLEKRVGNVSEGCRTREREPEAVEESLKMHRKRWRSKEYTP